MKYTDEQTQIINSKNLEWEYLFIQAFAGTGKTTTLIEFVKNIEDKKVLYLTFNNALVNEDKLKNKNFDIYTIHGLAFNLLNITQNVISLNVDYIQKLYDIDFRYANIILNCYEYFLSSTSNKPKKVHVYNGDNEGLNDYIEVLAYLNDLWENMNIGKYDICHDFYLKKFMLMKPKLEYDVILIDECQDITPCIMKILYNQYHTKKVFVGDIYQQIYSFRNVVNTFNIELDNKIDMKLSTSFRFGEDLCNLANDFLESYRDLDLNIFKIQSLDTKQTNIKYKYSRDSEHNIICRTNKDLIIQAYKFAKNGHFFEILGKEFDYEYEIKIFDTLKKHNFKEIESYVSSKVASYKETKQLFKDLRNFKWVARIEFVENFDDNIWKLIRHFNKDGSDIRIMNVHYSKGLEFENVCISDDFKSLINRSCMTINKNYEQDEYNLMYTCLTRAMNNLHINENIANFLRIKHNFNFNYLVHHKYEPCMICGSLTYDLIVHSVYNLPLYVKPNTLLKLHICSNCTNIYRNTIVNNFKFYR